MRQPITMVVLIGHHVTLYVRLGTERDASHKNKDLNDNTSQSIADELRYLASRCSGFSDEVLPSVKQTNKQTRTVPPSS